MPSGQPPERRGDWVGHRLGSGAFGTVHMWNKGSSYIAIKKCRVESQDMRTRWRQEMDMIERMRHPNIVAFIPIPQELIDEYPPHTSLGMEYCPHGDLRKFLYKPEHCCGLPEYHVRDIMCDIGSAIKYLHDGNNMHRDLKPENIVLADRPGCPGRFLFKVTDLGYAKQLEGGSIANSFVGTFAYLAPEIARGQGMQYGQFGYHSQVDYWSFGLVVFESITGIRPLNAAQAQTKTDNNICYLRDESGKLGYLDYIPKPHSLNRHLENEVTSWLKLVLMYDERRRGGQNNAWHQLLVNEISSVNYVKVLDIATMKVRAFPVDANARPQSVSLKIEREFDVPQTDQFLLMKNGESLMPTQSTLQQLQKNTPNIADDPVLYLFNKSIAEWPEYTSDAVPQITRYMEYDDVVLSELGVKRTFNVLYFDFLTKHRTCTLYRNALATLLQKVEKMTKQLESLCGDFLFYYQKTAGMVDLFKASLQKDINSNAEQDNSSGICVNEEFTRSEVDSRRYITEWETDIQEASQLTAIANHELEEMRRRSQNSATFRQNIDNEFIQMNNFQERHEIYQTFRKELRASERAGSQSSDIGRPKVRDFAMRHWRKIKEFEENILRPNSRLRQTMRFLIYHHTKLENIYFKMMEKRQRIALVQESIKDKQRDRQHMLWNMLQYMKDIYNTAVQYERDDQLEQDLTQELSNLHHFTQRFVNDTDLHAVIDFTAEELPPGPDSQPQTVPASPGSRGVPAGQSESFHAT